MGAIRELIAKFTLLFEDRGSRKAQSTLKALESQANALSSVMGQIFAATAIGAPFLGLVKLASDAQEQLNILDVAFEDNAQEVIAWAADWGAAVGRSRYTLQKLVAQMGVLVRPMMGDAKKAALMSKELTQLAVDISSLQNIPEQEALNKLLSGMSGETESIKRLGILMNQVNLEAFAQEKGFGKSEKSMTMAEKAWLRYMFIMEKGAFMLGDAERTQYMFANSVRALRDLLKDVGTDIGFFLLPAFTDVVYWLRTLMAPLARAAKWFLEFNSNTNLATGTLMSLALVIGAMLLPVIIKLGSILLPLVLLAFILDDVYTTLTGGKSILGLLANKIYDFADSLRDGWEQAGFFKRVLTDLFSIVQRTLSLIGGLFIAFGLLLTGNTDMMGDVLKDIGTIAKDIFGDLLNLYADVWLALDAGMNDAVNSVLAFVNKSGVAYEGFWQKTYELTFAGVKAIGQGFLNVYKFWKDILTQIIDFGIEKWEWFRDQVIDIVTVGIPRGIKEGLDALEKSVPGFLRGGVARVQQFLGVQGAGAGGPGGAIPQEPQMLRAPGQGAAQVTTQQSNQLSFTIEAQEGSSPSDIAAQVEEKVREVLDSSFEDINNAFPAGA